MHNCLRTYSNINDDIKNILFLPVLYTLYIYVKHTAYFIYLNKYQC